MYRIIIEDDTLLDEKVYHRSGSREYRGGLNKYRSALDCSYMLTELLRLRGITQCEFAKLMNTRQPHVHDWISGVKGPNEENMRKMAEVLGVSYEFIEKWKKSTKEEYKRQQKINENVKEIKSELERIRTQEERKRTGFFGDK